MTEWNFCPHCGEELSDIDEAAFCAACGEELSDSDTPADESGNRTGETEEERMRRKLAELATSDRATAPIYAEKYRRDYGGEPEEVL